MSKITVIAKVMYTLFDEGEYVWVTDDKFHRVNSNSIDECIQKYSRTSTKDGVYMGMNPARDINVIRTKENVATYRNLVVEFDNNVPVDEQISFMDSKKVPYTACIFSGSKSHHFIISLIEPIKNPHVYKNLYNRLFVYLDCKPDISMGDFSKLTRFPMGRRNEVIQDVKYIGRRVHKNELEQLFNNAEFRKKFIESDYFCEEFFEPKALNPNPTDRSKFLELMIWYVKDYLDLTYNDKAAHIQCPVCASEGHDNGMDNLYVTGPEMSAYCFADDDHNKELFRRIYEMKTRTDEENKLKNPWFGDKLQLADDSDLLDSPFR